MRKDEGTTEDIVPSQASVSAYRRIAIAFLVLTAVVVALVFYVVFARAEVVVMSEQQEVQAEFIVDVVGEPVEGEVRGTVLERSDSVSQTFPSTSIVKVAIPVEGRVRIESALSRNQTLVATTRLLTEDELLFRLKETVVVPAYGSVEVDVFSDEPGEVSAIGDATFEIPGLNPTTRRFFTVETVAPLDGGYTEVRMVTQGDIDNAADVLKRRLESMLIDDIRSEAQDRGLPVSGEAVTLDDVAVTSNVPVGDQSETFDVTVRGHVIAVFYDKDAFGTVAHARLEESLPYDRTLLSVDPGRSPVAIEKYDLLAGRAHLRVSASGVSVMSADAPYLDPERLAGISTDAAREYLESMEGVSSASIKTSPIWSQRMPDIAEHITVEVR